MISIKRGDSLRLNCQYKEPDDTVVDITNIEIKSQIRDKNDNLIAEFVVEKTNALNGEYALTIVNTNHIPVGNFFCDIQFVENGMQTSSDTFTIKCISDVTR